MSTILSCLLLCFSMMSYASDELTMHVNAQDPSFIVTLPANPTTGYQWTVVTFDNDLLTLTASHYEQPKTNLIGAGGQMHFTFTLNKGKSYPAHTEIILKYARSWEPTGGTMKNVKIVFQ